MNQEDQTSRCELLDTVHTNILKNKTSQRIHYYEIVSADSKTCRVKIVQEIPCDEAPCKSFFYRLIGRIPMRSVIMDFSRQGGP